MDTNVTLHEADRVRTLALEQAGHACDLCARGEQLEVHRRTHERLGFERQSGLIVLCRDCHRDHHRALVLRAIRAGCNRCSQRRRRTPKESPDYAIVLTFFWACACRSCAA